VIVNYRTPDLSLAALDSLLPQIDAERDIVLLVDNDSGDASVARLEAGVRERGPLAPVHVLKAPENRGYSAGVNLGVSAAEAEHYLVLNSDVVMREGAVDALLATARSEPQAAMVGPRLEGPDGELHISAFPYPSSAGELIEAAGTGPITRLFRGANDVTSGSLEEESRWLSFAAVLLSGEIIDQIGPMDEGFFMYFEDVDYCRRVRAAGGRLVECPDASVVHLRGASSPVKRLRTERKRLPAYFYDSRARYFIKHHGRGYLLLANACWMIGQGVASLREVAGRPRHNARRAAVDIWRGTMKPAADSRS